MPGSGSTCTGSLMREWSLKIQSYEVYTDELYKFDCKY